MFQTAELPLFRKMQLWINLMQLKVNILFEDSATKVEIPSVEDLERVLPAFLKDENDAIKARTLVKQLNSTINKINTLLD